MADIDQNPIKLKRNISLWQLTLFGTGTILGAGIYVLIGKVVGEAGFYAPWSFLLAAIVAGVSGLSYSEMSARYPFSAGEVTYISAAFTKPILSQLVGWSIILTGVVSAATLTSGLVGYAQIFIPWPREIIIIFPLSILGLIAIWGISASIATAAIITLLEIIGLLIVIGVGGESLLQLPNEWRAMIPKLEVAPWVGIVGGSFLAFYAFIGFEDMVNVAEEVIEPSKNIPLAIILSLSIACIFYLLIAFIAVLSLPLETIANSKSPLALLIASQGYSPTIISIISLIAIINGALVQIIMASRVLYGMAKKNIAPTALKHVHPRTRTPIAATVLVTLIIIIFALLVPLTTLAKITSFIVLFIFLLVNISLIKIKKQNPKPNNIYIYPNWLPKLGFSLCLALLILQLWSS